MTLVGSEAAQNPAASGCAADRWDVRRTAPTDPGDEREGPHRPHPPQRAALEGRPRAQLRACRNRRSRWPSPISSGPVWSARPAPAPAYQGPAAILYEVRPEAGFVLGLDVGREYLRGAVADLTGTIRSKSSPRSTATEGHGRVVELVALGQGARRRGRPLGVRHHADRHREPRRLRPEARRAGAGR